MRRKNALKTVIILLALVFSGMALYPTYELGQLQKEAEQKYAVLEENTTLTRADIVAALKTGNLELTVRKHFNGTDGNTVEDIMDDVKALEQLYEKIEQVEPRAIKLGLDLQGGSYLVYEVDLPQLLRTSAKKVDERFEETLAETVKRVRDTNGDFFEVLQQVFQEKGLRLNRYFGSARDSDQEVVEQLQEHAEDAVDRILEVLRNRIDQFGVSEPSITRQGSQRIVVELAGIKDVERAKRIIGTTALLEFKLEKEPEVVQAVLNRIDRVVKGRLEKESAQELTSDTTGVDTGLAATPKVAREKEVSLDEIFGEAEVIKEGEEATEDSTVVVDEDLVQERPFLALLRQLGGDIAVPTKNRRQVERILNSPEVQEVIPKDAQFHFSSKPRRVQLPGEEEQEYYMLYLLKKEPELQGSMIKNARANLGSELEAGRWVVNMELNSEGARIFSRVTGANVNKRMAIILDGKVVSIPTIQERIPHGQARITGMANSEEAKDLALVLRAGALEAPVAVIEERTVGPSLGQDSIRRGVRSALVGGVLVLIFMVVYYRLSGLVADVALLMNMVIIMAVLAGFHFTLTLPGVAGIILTIGMAVDANVLIFERIREELRTGKTVRAAVDSGYSRAFRTILDANITTLLTALVLYQFGTGPIKGFALTLSIGVATSMFTAIVVTRVIFDYFLERAAVAKLSI